MDLKRSNRMSPIFECLWSGLRFVLPMYLGFSSAPPVIWAAGCYHRQLHSQIQYHSVHHLNIGLNPPAMFCDSWIWYLSWHVEAGYYWWVVVYSRCCHTSKLITSGYPHTVFNLDVLLQKQKMKESCSRTGDGKLCPTKYLLHFSLTLITARLSHRPGKQCRNLHDLQLWVNLTEQPNVAVVREDTICFRI